MQGSPVAAFATPNAVIVGNDDGEWTSIDGSGRSTSLAPTGMFGPCAVDASGNLVVATWASTLRMLRTGETAWTDVMLGAAPLAMIVTERGVIAGDTGGGLGFVPTSSPGKIAIQDLTATEPIVDLVALGTEGLAVMCASGALHVTGWPFRETSSSPYRDSGALVSVDTSLVGRPYALFAGIRKGSAIVAGRRGLAVLSGSALMYVAEGAIDQAIRGVARFTNDRACVFTDAGDAWIVDASLARVGRLRISEGQIAGAVPVVDGTVLAWTFSGDLYAVATDGTVRLLAERDVGLAIADGGGYIAVHADRRVTRGRTWT